MNNKDREDTLTLEILEAIGEKSDLTQRHLAKRTGVALGLANSYLKRCVRKGFVKIQHAPANRYLYYLTPKGFSEKSRLTAQYLAYSFTFYRQAAEACSRAFEQCEARHWRRIALCGASDLAEIASIRSLEHSLEIVGILDPADPRERSMKIRIFKRLEECPRVDAWLLTDIKQPQRRYDELAIEVAAETIIVPGFLGVVPKSQGRDATH